MNDALSAMESMVEELESDPESADQILHDTLPNVYAKLNYAWHTRATGPDALDTVDHNKLTAFPSDFNI